MNGREFNLTIARIIMSLPYHLRAPFLYRAGLYDGFWYTVSELAYYLKLDENECRERIGLAAEEICKRLGAALEDYIRTLPMAEESVSCELRTIAAGVKATQDPNDVSTEMQKAVQSFGATFTMLGRSGIADELVAAVHGVTGRCCPHLLVRISSGSVDVINHVVATVFRKRSPIGDHPGGCHLGIFGLSTVTGHEMIYLDVDLADEESVDAWLSTFGINRKCPPDEPFLFGPLDQS